MLIMSVFSFPTVSISYYLSSLDILSWALSAVLFECSGASHGYWRGGKEILSTSHTNSSRLQGLRLPNKSPPLPFTVTFCRPLFLLFCPSSSSLSSQLHQTGAPWSPMRWGQRCSRLKGTLQIEFTLDETNRFACVYPPETGWPAPGEELSHLWTV